MNLNPNAADFLFKLASQRSIANPIFEQVVEQGPSHMKHFIWRCHFMGMTAEGQGRSKKEAKTAAAKVIKARLASLELPENDSYQARMEKKRRKELEKSGRKPASAEPSKAADAVASSEKPEASSSSTSGQKKSRYDYQKHLERERQRKEQLELDRQRFFMRPGGPFDPMGVMPMGPFRHMGPRPPMGNSPFIHARGPRPLMDISPFDPPMGPFGRNGNPTSFGAPDPDYIDYQHGRPPFEGPPFEDPFVNPRLGGCNVDGPGFRGRGFGGPMRGGCGMDPPFMNPMFSMDGPRGGPRGRAGTRGLLTRGFVGRGNGPMNQGDGLLGSRPPVRLMDLPIPEPMGILDGPPGSPFGGPRRGLVDAPFNEPMCGPLMGMEFAPNMPLKGGGPMFEDCVPGFDYMQMSNTMFHSNVRPFNTGGPPMEDKPKSTFSDLHVIERHSQIYPKEVEMMTIMKLAKAAEKGLKNVAKECNKSLENKLLGVSRVGDLAKGLILTGDRAVNLVVVCRLPPTLSLLEVVQEKLKLQLKASDPKSDYELHRFEEEAGFCVVYMAISEQNDEDMEDLLPDNLPFVVNATLTCTTLRSHKVQDPIMTAESASKEKESNQVLPKEKCLAALAEMRHTNWFLSNVPPVPSCVECIRLIKDLSNRIPIWTCLSDWAIELLCERALSSMPKEPVLGPTASVKRIFEVLSTGLLLPGGAGLQDPCEGTPIDATSTLTMQQRENITASAQTFLRQICFDQIHFVLGMERLPPTKEMLMEKKRLNKRRKIRRMKKIKFDEQKSLNGGESHGLNVNSRRNDGEVLSELQGETFTDIEDKVLEQNVKNALSKSEVCLGEVERGSEH